MSRFEKHPVLTLTVIVLAVVVGLVAVTETALRTGKTMDELPMFVSLPRPERHIRLREWLPNTRFLAAPPKIRRANPGGPVHDIYPLTIDSDGFIEPARVHAEPNVTVVFLGGSTTECLYVTPELRFPALAGRLMGKQLDLKVNGLNGAKSGNNTMHSLHILTGKVLPLRPDFVVLMNNVNDIGVLSRYGTYWTDNSDFRQTLVPERSFERVFRDLRDLLIPDTYRAFKQVRKRFAGLVGPKSAYASETADGAARPAVEQWADDYESALRQFVATAKAWNVRPVLLTQAALTRNDSGQGGAALEGDYLAAANLERRGFTAESFANAQAYFNQIMRFVAHQEGALLVDIAAAPWTDQELYDQLHFSDQGSQRVAALVAEVLVRDYTAPR